MKTNIIYNKSCIDMQEIEDNSIDAIITSPPYWGLRDYNVDGQIGLEPTLEEYIDKMLMVTAECKRVLKPTGVMWLNHGDCYNSAGTKMSRNWDHKGNKDFRGKLKMDVEQSIPVKCLVMQNYRLILKMIDEQSWILRNTVIWSKPNAMPSSVKDRLANKYEPVFMLVKNTKTQYYWNEKTGLMTDKKPKVLEEGIDWDWQKVGIIDDNVFNVRVRDAGKGRFVEGATEEEKTNYGKGKLKKKSYWHSLDYWFDLDAIREEHKASSLKRIEKPLHQKHPNNIGIAMPPINTERMGERFCNPSGKNPGDVWTIPTQPYPEAHFATFPEKLIIKPILSSCPEWICKKCGKARVRIMEKELKRNSWGKQKKEIKNYPEEGRCGDLTTKTIGWTDCGCNAGWRAGIILDPFAGSGTTLAMAHKYHRQYIGYELNIKYLKFINKRLEAEKTLFNKKEK